MILTCNENTDQLFISTAKFVLFSQHISRRESNKKDDNQDNCCTIFFLFHTLSPYFLTVS